MTTTIRSTKNMVLALVSVLLVAAATGGTAHGDVRSTTDGPTGVLRVADSALPVTLDPILNASSNNDQWLTPVYDTIFRAGHNGELGPNLAKSFSFSQKPMGLVITLRKDVKFHNGKKLTAQIVKQNILRGKIATSLVADDLLKVTSVTVLDPLRLRLNTDGPAPDLPATLTGRAGMIVDPAMFSSPALSTVGAGTGPFVVTRFDPGSQIIFKKAPGYWDPKTVKVNEIHWLQIDDANARINSIATGQADVVRKLSPAQVTRAKADPTNIKLLTRPVVQTEQMLFNTSKSEFGKQLVRQAINYAIDRKSIADNLLSRLCIATSQFAPPGNIMHSNKIPADYYGYDPAKARSLLQQAGLPNGFSFTALVVNGSPYIQYAQVIQAQLAQIKVNMKIQPVASSDIVNSFYVQKNGDAGVLGDTGANSPSQYAARAYLPDGTKNPGGTSTAQIQQLVEKVSSTPNYAQRKAAWTQLTTAAVQYAFGVQICQRAETTALSKRVVGFTMPVTGGLFFRNVGLK